MANFIVTMGQRIVRLRELVGMQQQELAALAGVSNCSISQIESGGRAEPRFTTVMAIAQIFGVDAKYLALGGKEPHGSDLQRAVEKARALYRPKPGSKKHSKKEKASSRTSHAIR